MPKVLDHEEYFWSKVVPTGFCWEWHGTVHKHSGYGIIKQDRVGYQAHRRAYEYLVGEIGEGFELDHLCRNTICVNPDHLDPVPKRVNILRGYGTGARFARRHHCPECGGTNWAVRPDGGRRCKTCANRRSHERRERVKGSTTRKWVRQKA